MIHPEFWQRLDSFANAPALIDEADGRVMSYSELSAAVASTGNAFRSDHKKLVFLANESTIATVVAYLALLQARHAVFLCGPKIDVTLVERYRPELVLVPARSEGVGLSGYSRGKPIGGHDILLKHGPLEPLHDQLALLLSTSGTTGSPKLVCLSEQNISAAAQQVQEALAITSRDRAIATLPLEYVYGLSMLHSHLSAGASLLLSRRRLMAKAFWESAARHGATSLAGVPWTYNLMREIGLGPSSLPSLRKLTQSGAKLDAETRSWLLAAYPPKKFEIYFMYGQTEAAGRICVLPPDLARKKPGSVGLVVPNGRLQTKNGEIFYEGPNVMLGYAKSREDLMLGDQMGGVLATGDLGEIDDDGCLYLTGRLNRICKILGNRIDLDTVEDLLRPRGPVAVIGNDEAITIWYEQSRADLRESDAAGIARRLRLPQTTIKIRGVGTLPRTTNGKVAYSELAAPN